PGNALPDTRTKRDTAQTLVHNDLAALFGLDMEECKALAPSHSADAVSAGHRAKKLTSVVENQAVAAGPAAQARAIGLKPAQEERPGSHKPRRRPSAQGRTS